MPTDCPAARVAASNSPGVICARTSPYARSGRRPLTMWTDEEGFESQARTPTGAAKAVRLAMRSPVHGEPEGVHFTICPKRLAASDQAERRGRNSKAKRGHPPGGECSAVGAVAPDSRQRSSEASAAVGREEAIRLLAWQADKRGIADGNLKLVKLPAQA